MPAIRSPKHRFSELFGVQIGDDDDWFDPLLPTDTELFVDPFRLYAEDTGAWEGAHDELADFFNLVLELLAKSGLTPGSAHWNAAARLLMFPEPAEFCLGYGDTPLGMGSGARLRQAMIKGASASIVKGIKDVRNFDELVLFQEQVGPDRMSDVVCNVLKSRFIAYTTEVCDRHGIPTQEIEVPHASWTRNPGWRSVVHMLPINPHTGRAVLLTPKRFLRRLPIFEGSDFWEWAWTNEADEIKAQFNYDIATNIKGQKVAELARAHPELARRFIRLFEKRIPPPYDVDRDPAGVVHGYEAGLALASEVKGVDLPASAKEFCDFVERLIGRFVWIVEDRGSWKLLWTENGPRDEKSAQQVFHTAMLGYCESNDIDLSPESHGGRGPVDFKFSKGWERRALVEIKLSNNTKFWHGLETQTPIYMTAEGIKCGYFVAIQYRDQDLAQDRIDRVNERAKAISKERGYKITPIFVDARPKPSASKA